jgi:hypothetical protein
MEQHLTHAGVQMYGSAALSYITCLSGMVTSPPLHLFHTSYHLFLFFCDSDEKLTLYGVNNLDVIVACILKGMAAHQDNLKVQKQCCTALAQVATNRRIH